MGRGVTVTAPKGVDEVGVGHLGEMYGLLDQKIVWEELETSRHRVLLWRYD